jgi:hypothetical protein
LLRPPPQAGDLHVDDLDYRDDPDGLSMTGVPLVSWDLLVALWHARGLIAAVGFALVGWFWLCRRYPMVAWFILGFLRGLLGGR